PRGRGGGGERLVVGGGVGGAGAAGRRRGLAPPPPAAQIAYLDEEAPRLPVSLDESLAAFEQDRRLRDCLGDEFVQLFMAVKRHEIAKARDAIGAYGTAEWPDIVTEWERENLFEFL